MKRIGNERERACVESNCMVKQGLNIILGELDSRTRLRTTNLSDEK
jgi:hypothetical protein